MRVAIESMPGFVGLFNVMLAILQGDSCQQVRFHIGVGKLHHCKNCERVPIPPPPLLLSPTPKRLKLYSHVGSEV